MLKFLFLLEYLLKIFFQPAVRRSRVQVRVSVIYIIVSFALFAI
jgi:hypothetical protein